MINGITPTELKIRLDANEKLLVIDVRLPEELEVSSVDFTTHIPMQEITQHLDEIPKDQPVVFLCRSGVRSMQVAQYLVQNGWEAENLLNLDGGILRWAKDVDPSLPEHY